MTDVANSKICYQQLLLLSMAHVIILDAFSALITFSSTKMCDFHDCFPSLLMFLLFVYVFMSYTY